MVISNEGGKGETTTTVTAVTTTEHGSAFPWRRRRRGQLRNDSGDNSSSSPLLFSILHKRFDRGASEDSGGIGRTRKSWSDHPRVAGSVIAVILFF